MTGPRPAGAGSRVDLDSEQMGRDLVALVLTVVELLRQLMERQAIRRVEQGDLSDEQVEEIGTTLMLLDQRMKELCDQHGVRPEDLNLDLGPLGTLLPRD
ncbi:gas vesicle protein K [Streptomyces sp. 021-4]|uniref:gas vesicle protein K n=1 Tax=Streptomyces sp. 021-4 TaxID=2789260 RepID=UPI0039F4F193